ncbi:MAG: NAD(P)/FAD-dependent oxidoreductase [Acidimicrobiia bacterium]|nr:NAD(P)/FAD-dependent oxidoreductase [Acidimicrobiia bacterium]
MFGAVARRENLDAALVERCRAAGAKVEEGAAVQAVTWDGDGVTLGVDGREAVRARYVVAADGMWSTVRRLAGAGDAGYLGEWHAFRQYFRSVGPQAADLWVWFEPDLLPGYAWSFPLPGGRANVGFGIQRSSGIPVRHMKELWPELLDRAHVREVLGPTAAAEAPHRAWPIPARIDRATLHWGRALFVGDAAAASDPMTGEGIAQALVTGGLAADAIQRSGPTRPDRTAATYERAVRRELLADHRMSALLGRVLTHRKGARGAVRVAAATDWTRRNFARWLFEDYPRAAVLTPRRWHRRMFTAVGAYAPT